VKIVLVIYGSLGIISGGYLYDRKLVAHLRSRGDQVDIISLPTGTYFSHLLNNISFRLPSHLDILIEDELVHPSVLVANHLRHNVPIISLVHNLHSSERRAAWQNWSYRAIEKQHLASVDGYIFNSEATRSSVTSLVGDGKPCVLAPPGGDRLGTITADAVRRRASRSGPLRLLFLANVTPLKGLHVLLDALRRLPRGMCALEVAGSLAVDRPYAQRMQSDIAASGLDVTFHGVLDDQPLIALLLRSDVLVVPSFWEGFGIAYLEGMAFGLPAIGTTAGAIPQMITHGLNGYMIEPGDSDSLAALLQSLASDRHQLQRLSANALRYFQSCPTWAQSGELVRQFLLQRLNRPTAPQA